ncbi:SPO22-domain-containing protein [Lentithecium fluviatile CBS 122367]|uniref:Protein ZIP4 homolog n=1 Tax=Lentithecium fluviatile CBS 122367 TaxID=1168545 RepID=A0A6G1JG44_9PLEO|nr:SPO22-domain-containing protein [Lentithecium fluviatile CBS 122367]
MAPPATTARAERDKKVKTVLAFAATLANRFNASSDTSLADDLEKQARALPLQASSTVTAKREELDRLGTELWNLSTRLRRNEPQTNGRSKEDATQRSRAICLLRVFSFLLLDSAGGQATKGRERKTCIRLIKVALKAAKVCIESNELGSATKVLERAADYQEALSKGVVVDEAEEVEVGDRLRVEYFAIRTTLAWRQDRMDTAEHMFTKCKQMTQSLTPATAENLADLFYDMGKTFLAKRKYEVAVRWLERAYDVLGEQDVELLSSEAGELRLSIMQSIAQAYMKIGDAEVRSKAWHLVQLMEADYEEKMAVSLLKLELLTTESAIDADQIYAVLHRMIRSVMLNEKNFKTIMHHIHKLKDHSSHTSCKLIDELIELRLFRDEKEAWVEKAVITRVWISCTTHVAEDTLDQLQELFDSVTRNMKGPFSAQATHAAQTLLWKKVDETYSQEQYTATEAWCRICLHTLFEKAGDVNKSKIARKMILCALARHDPAAAREFFSKMSDTGRDDRITRYLMYKVGLHSGDLDFVAECLDLVCRQSSKDATLPYACALDAQNSGNRRAAIEALNKIVDKYDHAAPTDVHYPALVRLTAKLLMAELVKDGALDAEILEQLCKDFEGACRKAKESRQRPRNETRDQFNVAEFEWFSKNTYNLSVKYCAEMQPQNLVRLLNVCIEFIKLLKENGQSECDGDLSLRLMFCHFIATCAFTTLARAEDNVQDYLQYYLQARKHGKEFRSTASENVDKLGESAQADIIAKHFQVVKLELEAALKLERWDEIDDLFDECWKFKNPEHYETLADLVLVIHSCVVKAHLDAKYQNKVLLVLQKIINMTWRQTNNDIVKLSRWIRCLYQLALTFDENISLKCVDQATQIASARQGERNHYPATELEWLATTTFNHAVDYYIQENDEKCQEWAEKALTLAQWAEDDGALKDLLVDKFSGLTWED